MLDHSSAIDRVFHALADGTRRHLVQRLSEGPAAVSELAKPLPISLAAVVQHLQVLEECGVIRTRKSGRVRTCELDGEGLLQAERWIASRRRLWEGRMDRLDALLAAQQERHRVEPTGGAAAAKPKRNAKKSPATAK